MWIERGVRRSHEFDHRETQSCRTRCRRGTDPTEYLRSGCVLAVAKNGRVDTGGAETPSVRGRLVAGQDASLRAGAGRRPDRGSGLAVGFPLATASSRRRSPAPGPPA